MNLIIIITIIRNNIIYMIFIIIILKIIYIYLIICVCMVCGCRVSLRVCVGVCGRVGVEVLGVCVCGCVSVRVWKL